MSCQSGRVDQALSGGFLLCWVAGDLTSFLGCFLANQLPVQIVTAAFYVNKDLIMISQFVYCKLKNQKVTKGSPSLRNLGTAWILRCGALKVTALCQLLLRNQERSPAILRNNDSPDMIEMSGFICGMCVLCVLPGQQIPSVP
ncbi:lysosomal amino acid transporter 1 homolog [Aphelocoma coerulescens]|uniref:lysosomal amino acid transporter 1 homolog n=1 Tax=Aphelocoma coerulescens TaxID=39617 RepID=UPI0036050B96